jgi:hypothetical protein
MNIHNIEGAAELANRKKYICAPGLPDSYWYNIPKQEKYTK